MSVRDGRVERYAELLLDTCLGVERGWQVIVWGTPWARPLLEEVMKQLGERGAYPLLRLTFSGGSAYHRAWLRHAPFDVISEPAPIEVHAWEQCDAWLGVSAPENTRDGADIPAERSSALEEAYRDARSAPRRGDALGAVLVPDAGAGPGRRMTLPAFTDFLYGSCLIDWKSLHKRISRHAQLFDEAEEVRIVGNENRLRLSVAGRRADVDAGTGNMPAASSSSARSRRRPRARSHSPSSPRCWAAAVPGASRLRFSEGRIVDASADSEEDFLIETLDTDEAARRIGELEIATTPALTATCGTSTATKR